MVFESAFINRPGFDPHSLLGAPLLLTPTRGDYLGEHTAKAFDEILPGRVLEENAILEAEKSEGTYDPDYLPQQEARDMFGTFPDTPKVRHSHAMSEEDWKASPFYRKEIEYRPDMTRTRARIMAENFDERRYRDALIANGDEVYGPVMKALSFGATLLGSLPDPVNVLPLGGGMRAASLAGKTGLKAAVKAGAKAGVVEGAAGAALSDAIVFPDLRARGEDLGFLDFLLDTAFGATLGGGLGALGGGIHGYLGNRRIEAQDRLARPLPQRFAEMPGVEADSSQWFGEEKAIATDTKGLRKNLKKWAKENFSGKTTVSNADTGWEVLVTPKGIEDSLSHGFDEPLARSVPFIPQIIESGIHVASTEKKAGLMSHIFANKIRLDGKDYVVGFVLREDDNGNRFYDHELTEIIDPGWLYRDPLSKKETLYTGPANRGDVMNILRDKLGVNDGSGRVMFQTGADPANARGAIVFRPEDGQALIALFKGKADISTVIHEGAGHFFLENLRAAAQLPNAPAWVRDGWGDVAKAIGADADPARAIGTEAHEAFANMAVDYFRRGEAPSIALTTTFQRFARWLAHIYRALTRRGELKDVTPEVKRIMDRLLVAEDQLRAREINRRVVNARNDEADLLRSGLAGREKRDVMRAQEKALADMAAGRPVDVGPVLRESQVLRKARALQREFPDPENRNASSDRAAPEPDYSVERQDDFPPAPEAKSGEDAEMADMDADAAVDADVEARIADLEARGNLDGEDAALLADAADQAARAERYGEIGQSVLECVMEVVE